MDLATLKFVYDLLLQAQGQSHGLSQAVEQVRRRIATLEGNSTWTLAQQQQAQQAIVALRAQVVSLGGTPVA